MNVLDWIARSLLPPVNAARRKRWSSTAPEISFKGSQTLIPSEDWASLLKEESAAPLVEPMASAGVVNAQVALARMYLTGEGAAKNCEAAVVLLDEAARSDDPEALNMLGRCHERGWGTPADPSMAAALYERAAARGHAWAMFNLADLHCRGEGVERDHATAYGLYTQAAERGHVKSLNMLGILLEEGKGVLADKARARDLFERGANENDCWAQFNLARILTDEGRPDAALLWLRRSLDCGFPDFWSVLHDSLRSHPRQDFRDLAQEAAARLREP
ncbi:tetratricopeptide repeat protein [Shinella zoogloeoides]|uniref:tetratricopeptide repeat protein n=1 Tax=Shinella zoogloeoides TaxID=352475 RepID=UPI0028ACB50D|nr:tetratricopeptide repeat protein [Shinella zoogloeoides]